MGSVLYLDRGNRGRNRSLQVVPPPRRDSAASLLRPGYNVWSVARAERLKLLVDAEAYFRAFHDAALRAQRSILVLAWDFNSQTRLHFDPVKSGGPPAVLGDFLNFLVRRRRGLHIHVLNWDYPMVFGADRELPPIYGFGWSPARRVHLRYDDTHPVTGCHHQKVAVIDDCVAFVGGIDLTVRRWDSPEHLPNDPRRTAYGKPYPPFHDLMVMLDGEAARNLGTLARERWFTATRERLKPASCEGDPWPADIHPELSGIEVGIARTFPAKGEQPAIKEVERLYLDMIASARKHLYIENQYFTAPRIAAALEERLQEPDGPEIVLVLRLLSHGWLEEHTMHVLRSRLLQKLKAADRYNRFRVYFPHVPGLPDSCCVDVHSKLMISDDRVLRIGSSNLCNRSFNVDAECDVAIEARERPHVSEVIRTFRDGLLAEHLAVPTERVTQEMERSGSMHETIRALAKTEGRSMRELDMLPEWPEAIVNVASVADPDEPIALEALLDEREAERSERGEAKEPSPQWGKLAAIAGVLLAMMLAWRYTPLSGMVNAENVIAWAKDFGLQWWAPSALMLAYTPACLVMFPRPLITLAAVIAFGPWMGFLYSLLGITFSSVVTYYIGRNMRRDTVRRLAGPRLDRMIDVLKKHGLLAMTLLRLVPIAPFAVESIVAGAVRMKVWHVAAGTAIGLLPGTLTTTIFGDAIETALSGSGSVNWWFVGGAALVLGTGMWAVKRWFKRMEKRMSKHGEGDAQPR